METNISAETTSAKCIECGGTYPTDDMIRHGSAHVCARCKPIFMQKLAEGAYVQSSKRQIAGFWRRFGAICLDAILLWIVNTAVQFLILGTMTIRLQPGDFSLVPFIIVYLFGLTVGACYEGFMLGRYGQTFGKMACNIQVVTAEGQPISYGRAFGRHFAKWISGIILAIGYIIAAFDKEGRTLHDHICNTRVVLT